MNRSEVILTTISDAKRSSRTTKVTSTPTSMPTTVTSNSECSVRKEEPQKRQRPRNLISTLLSVSTTTPCLSRDSLIHSAPAHSSLMTESSSNCSTTTTELIGTSSMITLRILLKELHGHTQLSAQPRTSHTRVSTILTTTKSTPSTDKEKPSSLVVMMLSRQSSRR